MTSTTSTLAALWNEAHERHDEDTVRLVLADALEESGEPANVARAEFVRVQCELAILESCRPDPECPNCYGAGEFYYSSHPDDPTDVMECGCYNAKDLEALRRRERDLLKEWRDHWLPTFGEYRIPYLIDKVVFRRGTLERVVVERMEDVVEEIQEACMGCFGTHLGPNCQICYGNRTVAEFYPAPWTAAFRNYPEGRFVQEVVPGDVRIIAVPRGFEIAQEAFDSLIRFPFWYKLASPFPTPDAAIAALGRAVVRWIREKKQPQ